MNNISNHKTNNLDDIFSAIVIHNATSHKPDLDFSLNQHPLSIVPPISVKQTLKLLFNPIQHQDDLELQNKTLCFFASKVEAIKSINHLPVIDCLPSFISQNLNNEVILDLKNYGAVAVLNDNPALNISQNILLSSFLTPYLKYIFSDELWSPQGKWNRIHHELEGLFESKKILIPKNRKSIAHYSLIPEARILEKYGYKGVVGMNSFDIYLPWMFSLDNLNELMQVFSREF
jgi:hypothetical protein